MAMGLFPSLEGGEALLRSGRGQVVEQGPLFSPLARGGRSFSDMQLKRQPGCESTSEWKV